MEVNDKLCSVTVPPPAIIPVGTSIYSEVWILLLAYQHMCCHSS